MKYLLISDTHGELEKTKQIIAEHPNLDGYFHLGDIGFDIKYLKGFQVVKGNHDHLASIRNEFIVSSENNKILCIHGNCVDDEVSKYIMNSPELEQKELSKRVFEMVYDQLSLYAKSKGCNILFFGHTHVACFTQRNGITLINPGSVCFGMYGASYAIVNVENEKIDVKFIKIK